MNRLIFLLCALLACPVSVSGQDDGIRVEALPQQKLPVRPGQYSGIAYIGGDRYAVVDDKLPGGGIVFFDLPLREDGRVRTSRIRRVVPEGTRSAGSPALDNEGVVWADGKLYVAAEGDQSIREYDLDGYPTGVSFPVPGDMGVEAIVKNGGFEAFSWNVATGRFWTTTEFPLKTDGKASRLHRIQCFDAGHQACGRWLYQMDEPVAESGQGAVMAYVHGISAMAALDDGRLIVLEREVFVPAGVPRLILDRSFTKTKLYVVKPSAGYGGILPKQLLCEFETRLSLNAAGIDVALANYEGMCLGPRLPDGRQTLILLADSQSGMASLARRIGRKRITLEIIKVLLLGGPCD